MGCYGYMFVIQMHIMIYKVILVIFLNIDGLYLEVELGNYNSPVPNNRADLNKQADMKYFQY